MYSENLKAELLDIASDPEYWFDRNDSNPTDINFVWDDQVGLISILTGINLDIESGEDGEVLKSMKAEVEYRLMELNFLNKTKHI